MEAAVIRIMRRNKIVALASLSAAMAIFFLAFSSISTHATSGNSSEAGIPPQLLSYGQEHPGVRCISGTVNPFSITSTTCPDTNGFFATGQPYQTSNPPSKFAGILP
jgi:hypothetical protein